MSKKRMSAKALNLFVALAMLVSLSAVLAPTAVADAPCDDLDPNEYVCDPTENPCVGLGDCCNLEVFISTYVKDPETGDFTAQDVFSDCEDFYVNAVVVNTGNVIAYANITAAISVSDGSGGWNELPWSGHIDYPPGCADTTCKTWEDDPNSDLQTLNNNPGDIADFWWLVHCDGPSGPETIRVNASAENAVGDCPDPSDPCYGEGFKTIIQTPPTETKCLQVRIIEAPGLTHQGGDTVMWDGEPLHWDEDVPYPWNIELGIEQYPESPFESAVSPCTNFGIKAMIINTCDYTMEDVNATDRKSVV